MLVSPARLSESGRVGKQPKLPIKAPKSWLSCKGSEISKTPRRLAQKQPPFKECVTAHWTRSLASKMNGDKPSAEIEDLVRSTRNPKHEIRNSKQIIMFKLSKFKTFMFRISIFDIRISRAAREVVGERSECSEGLM